MECEFAAAAKWRLALFSAYKSSCLNFLVQERVEIACCVIDKFFHRSLGLFAITLSDRIKHRFVKRQSYLGTAAGDLYQVVKSLQGTAHGSVHLLQQIVVARTKNGGVELCIRVNEGIRFPGGQFHFPVSVDNQREVSLAAAFRSASRSHRFDAQAQLVEVSYKQVS